MGRRGIEGILLCVVAALAPACGGKGGGGGIAGLPVSSTPAAFVTTPAGPQRSVVAVAFTLTDAESDPVDVTITYSADGGATYLAATPATGSASMTALATSPAGTVHTFLWNSVDDAVATGTVAYGGGITSVGTVNPLVRIRATPTGGTPGSSVNFTVDNTMELTIGVASALFPHSFTAMGNSETELGDLVADAMRQRYGTQLAFQNGWGIRTALPSGYAPANTALRRPIGGYAAGPPFDLLMADVSVMLPFGNRVVTRTVTGSQLWAILEQGVSLYSGNNNGFPQISGFSFTFDASNAPGSRVLSVVLAGGGAIAADAVTYTFATNDYLNAGGDNYPMLNDGQGTARENLAQVVADYIQAAGTITPAIAGRMTIVP